MRCQESQEEERTRPEEILTDEIKGKVVPRGEAVRIQKKGHLPGYHILKVNGKEYLRDNPDSRVKDNIDEQKRI